MTTRFAILTPAARLVIAALALVAIAGCQPPEFNPHQTTSEADSLTDAVQLTHNLARAGEAYFSPDMRWIIFQGSVGPNDPYQMYVAQLKWDGTRIVGCNTPIRITPPGTKNTCGYFSPDGESVIFASTATKQLAPEAATQQQGYQRSSGSYRWDMPKEMEIFRADGWKSAVSAIGPGGAVDLAKYPLTHNDDYDAECAYSPDGKWIVYSTRVNGDNDLFVMRADGSKQTRLTTTPGYDGGPFFSPDGKRLVYRSDRKGNNMLQIYVADLKFDASGDIVGLINEQQLTHNPTVVNWGPYWHPDGHHIIWATSLHGHSNYELYLMRDDGTYKTRITHTAGADILPVFSPDGRYLMWTTPRGPEKASQIWVARFHFPKKS
jgi:Tol biopolymer transport system component